MASNPLMLDHKDSPHKFSLSAEIRTHPLFMAIVAVAVIVIIYYLYKNAQGGQTSTGTQLGQLASDGQPFLGLPGQLPGGQQQPINITINNPPPPPNTGQPPPPNTNTPLLSSWPSNYPKWVFGNTVNVNGTTYTIGPGSNKAVWGVPGTGWSLAQWNQVPIAPGGKVLLFQGT